MIEKEWIEWYFVLFRQHYVIKEFQWRWFNFADAHISFAFILSVLLIIIYFFFYFFFYVIFFLFFFVFAFFHCLLRHRQNERKEKKKEKRQAKRRGKKNCEAFYYIGNVDPPEWEYILFISSHTERRTKASEWDGGNWKLNDRWTHSFHAMKFWLYARGLVSCQITNRKIIIVGFIASFRRDIIQSMLSKSVRH